jgi:beta-lactamase regulating signal transducer with metallopeptidase domain
MIWTLIISTALALAAVMGERAAASIGIARRFVWITATIVAVIGPVAAAIRPIRSAQGATANTSNQVGAALGSANATTDVREAEAVWPSVGDLAATIGKADVWALRGWLIASGVMLMLVVGGTWRMRRRSRAWIATDTALGRVFVSHNDGPAVVGALRPAIVVPQWALDLEPSHRDLLLRHEREHVRAHDSRVLVAAALTLSVFPWNAGLWWMLRRLRLAIEIDCDARVIRAVGRRRTYGGMLVSVGERYATRPSLAASMAEAGNHLEARITAMTMKAARRPLRAALPFALIAASLLITAARIPKPAPLRDVRQPFTQLSVADPKPVRGNPSPRYPDDVRSSGIEGHVTMTFSTDARGVPDTSTIQVIESSHKSFEAAVRNALPQWRYDSQGRVRFAVRFLGVDTEQKEAVGGESSPSFVVEGAAVMPVIVVAQLDRPAPRR